jgi:hypothetical protein
MVPLFSTMALCTDWVHSELKKESKVVKAGASKKPRWK